jgi:hypothetical protein
MLKTYIVAVVVLVGIALYVARQDERAAQQSAKPTAAAGDQTSPGKSDKAHPPENVNNPDANVPTWYGFFRWPNGTTTWVIILTLFVIAEQTRQTAKAAKATGESVGQMERQAEIMDAQLFIPYGAKLAVGDRVVLFGGEARFPIENHGQMNGHITSVDVEIIIKRALDGEELYRYSVKQATNEMVSAGKADAFTLVVHLPRVPQSGEDFLVGGTIDYCMGFKSTDPAKENATLRFVRVYSGDVRAWDTAWGYVDIDFREKQKDAQL